MSGLLWSASFVNPWQVHHDSSAFDSRIATLVQLYSTAEKMTNVVDQKAMACYLEGEVVVGMQVEGFVEQLRYCLSMFAWDRFACLDEALVTLSWQ